MMKRVMAICLCITFLMSSTVVYGASGFPDVPTGAWYETHVNAAADAGVIVGNSQGQFMPLNTLNVDQFIKTMVVAVGYDLDNGNTYWASTYMDKAREIGLIDQKEYPTQEYSSVPVSRGEMAKIISKAMYLIEGSHNFIMEEDIKNTIPDISDVLQSGYQHYIFQVYELGIITGDATGSFHPSATLTRAEAATVIHRVIDTSVRRPFEKPSAGQEDSGLEISVKEREKHDYTDLTLFVGDKFAIQMAEAEDILIGMIGSSKTKEVLDYAKTKSLKTQSLKKFWEFDDWTIKVGSSPNSARITIYMWKER